MVTARKGSLGTRSTKTMSKPNTVSIPKTTTVSKTAANKHKGSR